MGKFFAPQNEIVIDDDEDDSMALPGKGKVSETLREELSKELGTDISSGTDVDSVNLRIVKPRSARVPFPFKQRLVGVIIISIITIMALLAIGVSTEYLIISFLTLLSIGYVMAKKHDKPSFEAMVYMIIISFIILTGMGSTANSGLNIYASAAIIFLLLVFYKMTKRRMVAVSVVLYFFWLIYSSYKVLKNRAIKFDNTLIQKVVLDPMEIDYYN